MALLDDAPRSATVTADDELLVLEIGRAGFGRLLKQEPQIGLALLRVLAARVRSLERE
jgi:CRP-like cAMP-binding protein